ncbi:hypothetical protein [Lapillicoccus sp.]|uniref:hypothetical protein n=1 Tax=Lapillicoccus sp. TaxID=1909287 RepID=UPI0025CC4EE0|nr:hypothetical protein [Lapillicoccus sp.]
MRGAKVVGMVVVVALLVGCGRGSAAADGAVGTATPLPAGVIVAQYAYGSGDAGGGHGTLLSLFDEQSGRHLRDLVHLDDGSAWDLARSRGPPTVPSSTRWPIDRFMGATSPTPRRRRGAAAAACIGSAP